MSWKEVFEKGIASFKSGKLPEALSYMNQAAELQKDNYKIYDSRAAVHEKLGNLKDALLDSKNVINLAPQQWQGYTRAARVFSSLGKPESAIKMVDLALTRLRSDDPRYRGQLLDLREKAVQAQTATKKQHRLHLVEAAYHLGKLPTEIITEIFRIVVEADHSLVVRLSHICTHWRRITTSTPSLWHTLLLSNKHPIRKLRTWLERSNKRISTLVVRRTLSPLEFPSVLDQLKGLSWSHLEAIHVHSSFLVELQRLLTEISMTCVISNLKQLSLDECGSMDAIFTPDREWNLRELRSTGLTQFPETCWATLAQLRVLHLHKLPTQIPLSAIAAVPLLENLIIEFVQPMTILGAVDEPLHMVHLTSMELRNVENPFTVLGNVSAPSLSSLTLFGAISRVDEALLQCFCKEQHSLVVLRLGYCGLHPRTLLAVLSRVPRLETLQIFSIDGVVNEVLRFLAGKDAYPELQPARLPCPTLRHVDVSRCSDLSTSSAYALVKSRLQNGPGDGQSLPNCCKIESLQVDGCPKMDVDMLQWFRSMVDCFSCTYMTKKEARRRR